MKKFFIISCVLVLILILSFIFYILLVSTPELSSQSYQNRSQVSTTLPQQTPQDSVIDCGCGLCDDNYSVKTECIYKSKGETLEQKRDMIPTGKACNAVGCSIGCTRYIYCD
jgi:hypothetical protein